MANNLTKKQLQQSIAKAYAEGYKKGYNNGYADGQANDVPRSVQMYTSYVGTPENFRPIGYRFGESWISQQLFMEGGFSTEEEAYEYWYKEMIKDDQP